VHAKLRSVSARDGLAHATCSRLSEAGFLALFGDVLQRSFKHRPVGKGVDPIRLIPFAAELFEDLRES
jgi:hypothetical protein